MQGTLVNAGAILVGALIGALGKNRLQERTANTILQGIGLVVFLIGIQMALEAERILLVLISITLGALIGDMLDIHGQINRWAHAIERRFQAKSLASGLVTASILFCVGSMSILGPIQSGVEGVHTILYLKASIDLVTSIVLAASLGWGVGLSALSVLLFQGAITLAARLLQPLITPALLSDINAVGGLLILTIAINSFMPDKVRTANFLPALVIVICYHLIW